MQLWKPDRVYFEPEAKETELGRRVMAYCHEHRIEILETSSHNQIRNLPGKNEGEKYAAAKKSLVVGIKRSMKLEVCRPSADYQFSLMTNCPGHCEYCYLFTTQGRKPYVRIYANLEDLFETIDQYIEKRPDRPTLFEAASTGDPLGVEHITGTLRQTIEHFGQLSMGRLRVVTKFTNVDSLLDAAHNRHTTFRFSVNTPSVIQSFEHNVPGLTERIEAARKMAESGYPLGFIVAPIFLQGNWQQEYTTMLEEMATLLGKMREKPIGFELIQHRFTMNAKGIIETRFPKTQLDMNPETRSKKWGKYGRVKYVYPKAQAQEGKAYLEETIRKLFPRGRVKYFT